MNQQQRLRKFVKDQHMTHAELAHHLDFSRESVSRVLTGKQGISKGFIGRFFMAFGADATAEIFGTEHARPATAEAAA